MPPTVVLDPGHGGAATVGGSSPNNAVGPNGLLEKDVTLDLARRVAALLDGRATVLLTRAGDENRSLSDRARLARDRRADVFLSIHLNGWRDPAVDGSEAWIARHAGAPSRALARGVLDRVLAVTHARDRGVRADDLGVLLPERVGAGAAALLEVAFLTNPDEASRFEHDDYRQALAQAIAGALVPGNGAAAQALAASDQAEALAVIDMFRADTRLGVFIGMGRDQVADRAVELINNPALVQQGSLNLCGPAALHRLWIARRPQAFAQYLAGLFFTGEAHIGGRHVEAGDDLREKDYTGTAVPAMQAAGGICPPAEWIAMSSLRDSTNTFLDFEGMPDEDLSGLTTPAELAGWLRATGLYPDVSDEGNWFFTKGLGHALGLVPDADTDIALLINAHILSSAATSGHKKSDEFVLSAFPNHFVVLRSRITQPSADEVEFSCWTWGDDNVHVRIASDTFAANYYGAVIARAGAPAPARGSALEKFGDPVLTAADSPLVRADRVIPATPCGVFSSGGNYAERVPTGVVIHVLDGGTYADDIARWHDGKDCTPPHYVIRDDGEITQMVAEKFMAQHAGPGGNRTMIGIEHDGRDDHPENFTDEMYEASAALVRDICARNAIPVDRAHIIGHAEVPLQTAGNEHGDPAGYWDWDYYMALVRWDGNDQAARPRRDVMTTDNLSLAEASSAWHQADRDSGNSAWGQQRFTMGPLYFSAYGANYLWADPDPAADPEDAIVYSYTVPVAGTWGVSAWWPILANSNTATRIEVTTTRSSGEQPDSAIDYDQTDRGPLRTWSTYALPATPMWCLLGGAYELQAGDVIRVRILRRSAAHGRVIADAIRFLKI